MPFKKKYLLGEPSNRAGGEAKMKLQNTFSVGSELPIYLILPFHISFPHIVFHDLISMLAVLPETFKGA